MSRRGGDGVKGIDTKHIDRTTNYTNIQGSCPDSTHIHHTPHGVWYTSRII